MILDLLCYCESKSLTPKWLVVRYFTLRSVCTVCYESTQGLQNDMAT